MRNFRDQLHPTWRIALEAQLPLLDELEAKIGSMPILPGHQNVMKALSYSLNEIKVLIVGQDPYPNPQFPMGLAFSVDHRVSKLPQSLRNIFTEYVSDTGFDIPSSGDLTSWAERGVCLLNRTLTVTPGQSNSHSRIGWQEFTMSVARILGDQGVVAILWGSSAQRLGNLFARKIESVHPSPLSAYRGFFGSKPFTRCNQELEAMGIPLVDWRLP